MAGRGRFWPGEGGDAGGRAWDGGTPRRKPATMSGCSFAMMAVASRAWTPPPPLLPLPARALHGSPRGCARAHDRAAGGGGAAGAARPPAPPRARARSRAMYLRAVVRARLLQLGLGGLYEIVHGGVQDPGRLLAGRAGGVSNVWCGVRSIQFLLASTQVKVSILPLEQSIWQTN